MFAKDYQRPAQLYLYADRANLQKALLEGYFVLQPLGIGAGTCLSLSFSQAFQPSQLQKLDASSACLVIHQSEKFGERLHAAVQKILPAWVGIDGAVEYGSRSPLGQLFSKPASDAAQQEWLFAWRSTQASNAKVHPLVVKMGSIEKLAELREGDIGTC